MTIRRRPGLALLPAAVLFLSAPAPASDVPDSTSRISYVTSSSVYVTEGSLSGVAVGDRLDVVRGDQVVAEIQVVEVSPSRARCARVSAGSNLSAGDEVRKAAADPPPSPSGAQPSPADPPPAQVPYKPRVDWWRAAGLRGRVGLRFLDVSAVDGSGGYRQPALDLRLDGSQVGGAPIDLDVDVRAQRTTRSFVSGSSETETRDRIYRLSVGYRRRDEPLRFTLGRQFSPSLAVVSLFDGLVAEYRKEHWATGIFTGTQPDPLTYGYSSDVREYGAYYEVGSGMGTARRWAFTTGAVDSSDHGNIDRDFVFLQGRYDGARVSAYATEETDVNRGWKKTAEGDTLTLTSAFVSLSWRVADDLTVQGGFDGRRSVRLYRDSITPETEFDDRTRRGSWIGADGKVGTHVSYGFEGRRSIGGVDGQAGSTTLRAGVHGLGRPAFAVQARSTRYTSDVVEGWLHSVSASADLTSWSRLEVHGGTRIETVRFSPIPSGRLSWYGLDWDAVLARRIVLTVSAEQNQGASEGTRQVYTTVSYRF